MRVEIPDLLPIYQDAARTHMFSARAALERMREGWSLLSTDAAASRAFRWANEAMLLRRVRSSFGLREAKRGSDRTRRLPGTHPAPVRPNVMGSGGPFRSPSCSRCSRNLLSRHGPPGVMLTCSSFRRVAASRGRTRCSRASSVGAAATQSWRRWRGHPYALHAPPPRCAAVA